MKNVTLVAVLATSIAFSANAMSIEIDTDGDGFASMVEMQVAYPDLTEEQFLEVDTDGDSLINNEEMAFAVELGTLLVLEIKS